jgi:hypothetical protein
MASWRRDGEKMKNSQKTNGRILFCHVRTCFGRYSSKNIDKPNFHLSLPAPLMMSAANLQNSIPRAFYVEARGKRTEYRERQLELSQQKFFRSFAAPAIDDDDAAILRH